MAFSEAESTAFNKAIFYFPNIKTVSQYPWKLNFIYARKKSMAFARLIFMQLTNAQQHLVQTSYTKFQPNKIINAESIDKNSLIP
jgi:hypothetical protein